MRHKTKHLFVTGLALAVLLLSGMSAEAQQFRRFNPILTPDRAAGGQGGSVEDTSGIPPLPDDAVRDAARNILDAWNGGGLERYLAPEFFDASRLIDNIDRYAPRNARITLLSVQGIAPLETRVIRDATGGIEQVTDTVTATVRYQIEYTDEDGAFQRREGRSEFLLRFLRTPSS